MKVLAENQTTNSEPEAGLDNDARWILVQRIVGSPLFSKTERLSDFLLFVCKMSLEGRNAEINEQAIGSDVFERPANYDAANDNIVRIHASRLRQRLKQYFDQSKGDDSPFIIEIPKGAYVPVFIPRLFEREIQASEISQQTPVEEDSPHIEANVIRTPRTEPGSEDIAEGIIRKLIRIAVPAILTLSFCWALLSATYFLSHPIKFKQIRAIVSGSHNPLWTRLFRKDRNTIVVTADSSLVVLQNLSGNRITLEQYAQGGYSDQLSEHAALPNSILKNLADRRYTSIVDLNAVQKVFRVPGVDLGNTQIRYSRDLHPNDFKQGNFILLGTYESTPWVQMFEPRMNFYFVNDLHSPYFLLMNRKPQRGEQAQYTYDSNDPEHTVYGVVAFQPTLSGSGDALILEGQTMAGTEAATDFVFDDTYLLPFLNKIKRFDGSIPHFEILIASKSLNGDASHLQIVAYRVE